MTTPSRSSSLLSSPSPSSPSLGSPSPSASRASSGGLTHPGHSRRSLAHLSHNDLYAKTIVLSLHPPQLPLLLPSRALYLPN